MSASTAGATAAASSTAPDGGTPLHRGISRNLLLFFVLGDILGAGIYALVGTVAGRVGGAIWLSFLVALLLAIFTAFAYAELVTKYPNAGGAALYVNKAFGVPFLTFLVTFAVMMSGITSASTLSRAFGGDYLAEFISVPTVVAALVFIAVVALINFRGIAESVRLNVGLTLVELGGLVLITVIALAALLAGDAEPSRATEFKGGEAVPLAILGGAALAFYALIGFEDSVNVSEECQEPHRDYPRALLGGLLVAGVIYLVVTALASMAVPTSKLADSDGPLLEVVQVGPLALSTKVFAAIALLAVANGALINMIMASRLLYGMANQHILPAPFGRVHPGRQTPWVAIIFTTLIAVALISFGSLEKLASTTVFLLLIVFTAVNLAVLRLKRDVVAHPHFRAPAWAPILGAVVSAFFIVRTIVRDPDVALIALGLLGLGALLFVASKVLTGRPPSASART